MPSTAVTCETSPKAASPGPGGRLENNFDLLRFMAATLVIFSHSYSTLGLGDIEPLTTVTKDVSLGVVGVMIFFTISGYLITKSWDRQPSLVRFSWKRLLRIIPGIFVASLFLIFIIGPLVTRLPLGQYLLNPQTIEYLKVSTIIFSQDSLPGVFENNPIPALVNAPFWTIYLEFKLYALVAALGIAGLVCRRAFPLAIFGAAILAYMYVYPLVPDDPGLLISLARPMNLAIYFIAGMVFYVYRDRIPVHAGVAVLMALFLAYAYASPALFYVARYASFLLVPYIVLSIAFLPVRRLNRFGARGDLSYGLYIYAWPVQQTICQLLGAALSPFSMFALAMAATLPLAFLSWNLVESPALGLKKVYPPDVFRRLAGIGRTIGRQ